MIHLLGAGSIGSLIAVNLAKKFPVTLLLRGPAQLQTFKQAGELIRMKSNGVVYETPMQAAIDASEPISKLVLCTKAPHAHKALEKYAHLLRPDSSVLVVHNGMGLQEEIKSLWPAGDHPRLSFAVTTTGVQGTPFPWTFQYGGAGMLSMASETPDDPLVADVLAASSMFLSEQIDYSDFIVKQLEKLVVNASINPVTAMLGVKTGRALELDTGIIDDLIFECCAVLRHSAPGHLADKVAQTLNPERMVGLVRDVCRLSPDNVTSMLADLNGGRTTEIDYINGYVVREAKRMGRTAKRNETMVELIQMKTREVQSQDQRFVPLELETETVNNEMI